MIRMVLLGRTGNNLFQYALGRVLAGRHGVPLALDASWFNLRGWREVSHWLRLPLRARVVRRISPAARVLRKLTGKHYGEYRGGAILKEKTHDHSFDPAFLEAPGDCVIFGYFQSPAYFENIAEELRAELGPLISGAARIPAEARRRLERPDSVAVHVRRKDYLDHAELRVCGRDYYLRAMEQMRENVPGARFLVFSDDPEWCEASFRGKDQEVFSAGGPAGSPLLDLQSMSLASHHIIANSSYSWWAAWLGKKPGQRVIAPDRWFNDGIKAPIAEKLCPGWATAAASVPP